ncbi:hypothetical protein [Athalassotoga saccharophila]|uniref:hypothetical protein n=1 Tax=Athalassotoga saccharophila TaxID=1441386 RepID=UPI0013794A74|nr:hypothetical protein [Athalassotoga saccharophila]BBJ28326.1 hypothetical protein ATHSA_1237 [Athalassotoga saccharophila]
MLACGWKGIWVDGNQPYVQQANINFKHYIETGKLEIINSFITKDNINKLLSKAGKEVDLLSIDIDGNDFYIWEAIDNDKFSPRVVIIEYNGSIPPEIALVQPYIENFKWNGSNDSGASLKALEILGKEKGYYLVGTGITGVNAFFVRKDLWSEKLFSVPPTAENLYNPARYELLSAGAYKVGHRPAPSKFINIPK